MSFDPAKFMQSTVQGELSTQRVLLEPGEYVGVIRDVELRQNRGRADPTKVYTFCDCTIALQVPPEELARINRQEATVRHSFMIDLTDSGDLDIAKGRNISLGRLRDAVGQNTGAPWSFIQLKGAGPLKVKLKHGADARFEEVDSIGKM